jgi:hypothetical protein
VRIERKVGVGVAILGSALLAMSGAIPALARSGPSARLAHASGVSLAKVTNATSTSFGGWAFMPKTATSVTSEFKVPTLTCTAKTTGVGPITVMATGKSTAPKFNAAGILLECAGGRPAAAAAVVLDGVGTTGTKPLFAGDLMKSTVTTSATKTTVTVQDLTTGHTFKLTKSGTGGAALQELIIDDSLATSTGTQLPVANFGKITFSKGAISTKPLGMVTPSTGVNMETAAHVLQILTGALSGTKKDTFLTTWKHS